jgi:Bacteriophage Mu Gp45 spike protein
MHRQTPLNSSLRGFFSGGSASVVDQVDDTKLMQEGAGNFMASETRKAIQSPQNYGFTSVVFDAEKDAMGKIQASAETFMSFLGGNRSYPVNGNMDDRRHRMFQLEKGDTAMFRGRGDKQQFHMTQDGGFWTAPQDKTVRMHLLQQDSESNSTMHQGGGQSGSAGPAIAKQGDLMPDGKRLPAPTRMLKPRPFDGGSSGGGSSGGSGQNQNKGQTALYKDGQKSPLFVEVTKDKTRMGGNQCHLALADGNTYLHCHTDKQVYVGAEAGKASFDYLVTLSGPCVNSLGKIG